PVDHEAAALVILVEVDLEPLLARERLAAPGGGDALAGGGGRLEVRAPGPPRPLRGGPVWRRPRPGLERAGAQRDRPARPRPRRARAGLANSMSPTCRSRVDGGEPQAKPIRDFRIGMRCQSCGKTKSRWFRHQTFRPRLSISLNSKLFGRPSPRSWKVKA